ncbi:cache domain-containing protein [Rhodococcus sp. ABRD24]|uniref:cache domain-containing protein n=1 Tax=Rhodococcus sp. ABRD24 TaxID=2507582 RepID=UPI001F621F06|nr:cache domain-containing protein [Rhodococcus sp. ABRD24]
MELAIGVGFAVDYTIDGRSPAMVWWRRKDGSVIARTHGSDPDTDSFYDYASLRWFAAAKQSKQTTVSGPFIDSWGTDDYTVTVSYPVLTDDDCAGVLAADVDLPQIVEAWTEAVGESEREMALVNENDRVVASTVPTLSTGLLIRPRNVSDSIFEVEQRCAVSKFGWSIVVLQRR